MKSVYIGCIIVICLLIAIIFIYYFKNKTKYPQLDTLYIQSIDVDGNIGYVHDIGFKSKEIKNGRTTTIQLLKTEIVNGVKKRMGKPQYLKVGRHPSDLRHKMTPDRITEHPLFYMVELKLSEVLVK